MVETGRDVRDRMTRQEEYGLEPRDFFSLFTVEPDTLDLELQPQEKRWYTKIRWADFTGAVGGVGFISSGEAFTEATEARSTLLAQQAFQEVGAAPLLVPIDAILLRHVGLEMSHRIRLLGDDPDFGVRDTEGRPRTMIVTGFTTSRYIRQEHFQSLLELAEKDMKELDRLLKMIDTYFDKSLEEVLMSLPEAERELFPALVFLYEYAHTKWQSVAARKNTEHETIIFLTVAPRIVHELVIAVQTAGASLRSPMFRRSAEYYTRSTEDFGANID